MADLTVTEGDVVVVRHETINRGDVTTDGSIVLKADSSQEDSETREIEPDETVAGVLTWTTEAGDGGTTYTVAVEAGGKSDSISVQVNT